MAWLSKFPGLTLTLLFIVYIVFGFYAADKTTDWSQAVVEQSERLGWTLEKAIAIKLLKIAEVSFVAVLTMVLAIPMALTRFFVGKSLKSENYAILTFLVWSFVAVFLIRWFEYFLQIFVLVCTTLLCRLDLQRTSLKEWQIFLILILVCLGGFKLGMLTFMYYHPAPESHA